LLGVSTYIGALQANFGNIYETGIYDIQNNIKDLENATIKNKEIFDLNIDEVGRLSNAINELNFELSNYTNEIEDQNILLNDQNQISEILLNQIEEINNSLIDINEGVNELSALLLNESLSDEEISSLQFQLDNLKSNKLTLENSIDTSVESLNVINSDILSIQSDIEELNILKFDLETDISNSNNLINSLNQTNEQLSIENIDLENQIFKFQQELELVIENVKPGVGSDSEWQVVNLDTNNDGVINEFDLEIN
jgi:chromosome segregation ATPase